MNQSRFCCHLLLFLPLILLLNGCGDELQQVTGKVEFEGGDAFPQAEFANIIFEPVDGDTTGGVSANIDANGRFSLSAYPGDYKVYVKIFSGYGQDQPKSFVAEEYTRADKTPLDAAVEDGEENEFTFTVKPPGPATRLGPAAPGP